MKNRDWLILAMILVPLIGILLNIYALFLFIPLGFFLKTKKTIDSLKDTHPNFYSLVH